MGLLLLLYCSDYIYDNMYLVFFLGISKLQTSIM